MTSKHFERIAKAVRLVDNEHDRAIVAELLARVCAESNDRFDKGRFLKACGVANE